MMEDTIIKKGLELSKDGKTLIRVTDISYFVGEIPEGIEIIADKAFEHTHYKKITLPSTIKEIGESAFASHDLAEINLPEGLTKIGKEAFAFTEISEITIPGTLKVIAEDAFAYSCINRVVIEDGVQEIGAGAFQFCDELEFIKFPDSVTTIGEKAFTSDDSLQHLVLPKRIRTIGDFAFSWCMELHISAGLPITLKSIGDGAFQGCKFNEQVILTDNLEHIGGGAFVRADISFVSETLQYELDDNFIYSQGKSSTISMYGVAECVAVDKSSKTIGYRTFLGNEYVRDVYLPEGITEIGEEAFKWTLGLKNIALPQSLKKIGCMAFFESGINELVVPEHLDDFTLAFANSQTEHVTILCKRVSDNAFMACSELTAVRFGSKTKEIGKSSFMLCGALRKLEIPEGIEVIDDLAFSDTNNIKHLHLPHSLKKIGNQAFSSCDSLEQVIIDGSIESWGNLAFSDCKSLLYITLCKQLYDKLTKEYKSIDPYLVKRLRINKK